MSAASSWQRSPHPAVALNAGHGQTGFLTTFLFGTGAWLLARRPFAAGLFLGALSFKPHLGLLIPIALLYARNWRAVLGAAVSVVGLATVATAAFGPDAWQAFLEQMPLMQAAIERGLLPYSKLVTTFAGLRLVGAPLALAYLGQAAVSLAAALAVGWVAWRRPSSPALGPVLVAASLLPSPYLLDYDLTLAAIPLAWLLSQGRTHGFLRWEKAVLLMAFVLPLVSNTLQSRLHLPVAPEVLMVLLAACIRRAMRHSAEPTA